MSTAALLISPWQRRHSLRQRRLKSQSLLLSPPLLPPLPHSCGLQPLLDLSPVGLDPLQLAPPQMGPQPQYQLLDQPSL